MNDQRLRGAAQRGRRSRAAQVPQLSFADFRRTIVDAVAGGQRVAALFGDVPDRDRQRGPLRRPRRQRRAACCTSARRRWTRTAFPR